MPSQSEHDDLPSYQQPALIGFIADRLLARARERRAAAANLRMARLHARLQADQTTFEKPTEPRTRRQPKALPHDPVRYRQPASERQRDGQSRPSDNT